MSDDTCHTCGRSDLSIELAAEVRGDCPYCGDSLTGASLRTCCIPDCRRPVPVAWDLPVCQSCGVKIALTHFHDAAKLDAVMSERRRDRHAAEEAKKAERERTSFVYYVRLDEQRIKIGYTSRLRQRIGALRVHPSALLAYEPGGREVEKARHEQFAADRLDARLEDFTPSPALLTWIDDLRRLNDVPGWAKAPDTRVRRSP